MNMVGTPYSDVALAEWTALRVSRALKLGAGMMIAPPWVKVAKVPMTMPKVWKNGTGTHTRSFSV